MCTGYAETVAEGVSEVGYTQRIGVELDPMRVVKCFVVLRANFRAPLLWVGDELKWV